MPVPYYHVVFTLPDEELHPLYLYNRKLLYDLLFQCAAQTLPTFGKDPRWLGAGMGFFGVLHTWGRTLWKGTSNGGLGRTGSALPGWTASSKVPIGDPIQDHLGERASTFRH